MGRALSVCRPSAVHNCLHRSQLFDSFPFEIICSHAFVGKLNVIDCRTLIWSVERTDVLVSHSPSLSLLAPSRKYQFPVKVAVAAPLLCLRKVPS
jgi:hypothetical protein